MNIKQKALSKEEMKLFFKGFLSMVDGCLSQWVDNNEIDQNKDPIDDIIQAVKVVANEMENLRPKEECESCGSLEDVDNGSGVNLCQQCYEEQQ